MVSKINMHYHAWCVMDQPIKLIRKKKKKKKKKLYTVSIYITFSWFSGDQFLYPELFYLAEPVPVKAWSMAMKLLSLVVCVIRKCKCRYNLDSLCTAEVCW